MRAHLRRLLVGAIALGPLLVAGLVAPAAGTAATADHTVSVINAKGRTVAEFTSAKCRVHKGGSFAALTGKTGTGYSLFVSIESFNGFGSYDLTQGANADPYVSVLHGGQNEVSYSNLNVPPFQSFGFGQIVFRRHGKLMGVGYSPAYAEGGTDAVTFTGVLRCEFPKKKRR
jgi:hypothetical protein